MDKRSASTFLRDGRIAFEEQAVTGGRRPDFVLPSLVVLKTKKRTFEEAMVLSAKTTLRERWKQVAMEKFNCTLFLATVDDRVAAAVARLLNLIKQHQSSTAISLGAARIGFQ